MRFANLLISGLVLLVLVLPSVSAAGPVIHATWTSSPPTIDGVFTPGEWSGLQIVFEASTYPASYVLPTYVYFVNDASNLYVMVDAVGDTHDDIGDECLMWFNYDESKPGYAKNEVKIEGTSGIEKTTPFHAKIGFGSSPNEIEVGHKIYEFSIPLSWLGIAPGQPIEFCSPKYQKGASLGYDSFVPTHDNIWPIGLIDLTPPIALDLWGQVQVSASPSSPVGGFMEPVNKLAVFAPYLALFGVIGAVAVVFWKRPDN